MLCALPPSVHQELLKEKWQQQAVVLQEAWWPAAASQGGAV